MKSYVLAAVALIVFGSCSVKTYPFGELATGVYIEGREIIVADRNAGADSVGQAGSYMTWKQAHRICPRGYHLMTVAEARLLFRSPGYNSGLSIAYGKLRMPLAGYSKPPAVVYWNLNFSARKTF